MTDQLSIEHIKTKLSAIDSQHIAEAMNDKGYAIIPNVFSREQCLELINNYEAPGTYRKTVVMERYRFGIGEYKYFDYPLPSLIQTVREKVYPKLAPIANRWMRVLNIDKQLPDVHAELLDLCHANNQLKPTPLILKYGESGYNTLHQDLYGEIFFPMQAVIFLSDPEEYEGGEFVLTQQVPRAQSKAMVLKPNLGEMLIFTTNFRPIKGKKGYYRANMKHGVSEIHQGSRYTLGIIFHDAIS